MGGSVRRAAASIAGALVVAAGSVLAGSSLPARIAPHLPTQAAPAIELLATSLIVGATGQTLSIPPATPQYIQDSVEDRYSTYIGPTGLCAGGDPGCELVAVYTPEQMFPFTGLQDLTLDQSVEAGRAEIDACIRGTACMVTSPPYTDTTLEALHDTVYVVSGQSQSALIGSVEKAYLIANPAPGKTVRFVLTSSPSRPNGGIGARFPGLQVPFIGMTFPGATPTDSPRSAPMLTVDIARQYDGWCDFPVNPLNLLSDVNAVLGALFLHSQPLYHDAGPQLQGIYQDSTYLLAPTTIVPLLVPVAAVPLVGMPLAKLLDAPLRVLVETGYDRTINPGQATTAKWLYFPNPIKVLRDFAIAIPTGWDDSVAYVTGDPANRPFHTAPQGVYGVGGPPVYAGAVDPYTSVPQPYQGPAGASFGTNSQVAQTVTKLGPSPRPALAATRAGRSPNATAGSANSVRVKPRPTAGRADTEAATAPAGGAVRAASTRIPVGKH